MNKNYYNKKQLSSCYIADIQSPHIFYVVIYCFPWQQIIVSANSVSSICMYLNYFKMLLKFLEYIVFNILYFVSF